MIGVNYDFGEWEDVGGGERGSHVWGEFFGVVCYAGGDDALRGCAASEFEAEDCYF